MSSRNNSEPTTTSFKGETFRRLESPLHWPTLRPLSKPLSPNAAATIEAVFLFNQPVPFSLAHRAMQHETHCAVMEKPAFCETRLNGGREARGEGLQTRWQHLQGPNG